MLLLPCDRTVQSVDCVVVKMSYFAGLLLNEGINWILKHLIKELRPLQSQFTALFYCQFWCGILYCPEWRHLANTIKLFVLGRDADFCQMTMDTCYRHHCAKRMQRYLVCRGRGGNCSVFRPQGRLDAPMGVKFGVSSMSHFTPLLLDLNPTPHRSNLKNNLNLQLSKQRLYNYLKTVLLQ